MRRTLKFMAGGVSGAAVGAAAALLLAPESGHDLYLSLRERIRKTKLAGAVAKADRKNELIQKFRTGVSDQSALKEVERETREAHNQAVVALGLGLNAPGAIASQEIGTGE